MITLAAYPENTLEGLIARKLVTMITEIEDARINLEPITNAISGCRALMREAGWDPIYIHNFLVRLRNDLTELTDAHPVTRQFVEMLDIELEFN